MSTFTLQIEGMSCGHCLNAVNKALSAVSGAQIESVQIGRAVITTQPGGPNAEEIAAVVTRAGYPATAAAE